MFLTREVSPQRVRVYPRLGWRADVSACQGRLLIVPRVNHCTSVTDGPRGILRDGKAIILPLQRPWQRIIYAFVNESERPGPYQHGRTCCLQQESVAVVCSKQSSEKAAPERAEWKQLYDLCPGVMAPYWLLSLSNGSPRTPDFTRRASSLLLRPLSRKQECDNEAEEAGKCISHGFSFLI